MTEIKTEIICEDVTQKSFVKNKFNNIKNNEYDLNMSLKALDTKDKNKTSLNKDS